MKDNRGTYLCVGAEVTYNLSGQIALGKILSLKERKVVDGLHKSIKYNIKIENICPKKGHVSTVTQPKNVMVLLSSNS